MCDEPGQSTGYQDLDFDWGGSSNTVSFSGSSTAQSWTGLSGAAVMSVPPVTTAIGKQICIGTQGTALTLGSVVSTAGLQPWITTSGVLVGSVSSVTTDVGPQPWTGTSEAPATSLPPIVSITSMQPEIGIQVTASTSVASSIVSQP